MKDLDCCYLRKFIDTISSNSLMLNGNCTIAYQNLSDTPQQGLVIHRTDTGLELI